LRCSASRFDCDARTKYAEFKSKSVDDTKRRDAKLVTAASVLPSRPVKQRLDQLVSLLSRRARTKARSDDMNRASIGATSFAGSIFCPF
jgi:hypothetical protein